MLECAFTAIDHARRSGRQFAVIALSLDQFDAIHAALGPAVCREVLDAVACRIDDCLPHGAHVSRCEGNEYAIVLPEIHSREDVWASISTVCDAIEQPIFLDGNGGSECFVTASAGVSLSTQEGASAEQLWQNARATLCEARKRPSTCLFGSVDAASAVARRWSIENRLRRAMNQMPFQLLYQPLLDFRRRIMGAEALLRWPHPGDEPVSQADFIRVAEESGLIVPIGEWVLRRACEQALVWQNAGLGPLRMAINVSPCQTAQPDFADTVARILQDTGFDPRNVELELTESCVVKDLLSCAGALTELRALGIRVAIDDFGSGYSCLQYLKKLPVDRLKIDRSFIRDIAQDADTHAMVSAIVTLAHNLGLEVTAEGIESAEQLRFLRRLKCDAWQGYLCSRPVTAERFEGLLEREQRIAGGPLAAA
jgi:diguanylate cyclase (GGDEF)-like protein